MSVGLVLAGGGARGAYEAGALSVLLPALDAEQARPTVLAGTSVGAINAAHVAASSHLPASEAMEPALRAWGEVERGSVIRPIIARQAPLTVLRYAGGILSLPGARLESLLDPGPLERNLGRWIDWTALHANVAARRVASVAAVATDAAVGRTVTFVESPDPPPAWPTHSVDYVPARIGSRHLLASAAIPILFPPVRLESEDGRRGWFVDGGTRLNTPVKPALDLGAERLVIVATGAAAASPPAAEDPRPPDFGDGALNLLDGTLVDPLIENLHHLGRINHFLAEGGSEAIRRFRAEHGRRPYRQVRYVFVGPRDPKAIGELAGAVFAERYRGLRGLRSPDMQFLNRLIGGESATHGELLSYLFFDPVFMRELIAMGRRDARDALGAEPTRLPWRMGPTEPQPADDGIP